MAKAGEADQQKKVDRPGFQTKMLIWASREMQHRPQSDNSKSESQQEACRET
jgi:hypothetical protein